VAAFDHELQLVSYQLLLESAGVAETRMTCGVLVFTRKTRSRRGGDSPSDASRKARVVAMLETAVEGIAAERFHPQPGMHCSWCQYHNERRQWPRSLTTVTR